MRLHTRTLSTVAALITGASLLAAPAAAFAAPGEAGHQHGTAAIGEPAKATAKTRTVQITMGDNYYEPNSVQVKAGETVRFVVTNKGEFLHEFNIGTAAMHAAHQKEMAVMMEHGMLTPTGINKEMANMDHSRMPGMEGTSMTHDDPNSVLIEPGKARELTWKFTKNAALEFACNIPGHYESGMVGKVDVQR
ncbi:cupredoxin domain-containing protein [Azospirillum isscasi]|uniref:Cupredoxin family protein n=1 Tax=Azospirillum isscasi TaxID=3053926 RepID=A0ABU0WD76_9PROT|nr:cupredoxin family protein [Azospirillum isscasi]MDQ2102150.1 cupredoxin family protein [Azospirillum isscasi]